MIAAPPNPATAVPGRLESNNIDVRLRAVPSPPPEPVESTTPRIRLPNYAAAQPMSAVHFAMPPSAFYPSAAPPTYGAAPTVHISPSSPPQDSVARLTSPPGMVISADGFRPRGSMR
jgi:hypothetical protein